jgi:isopenicillin N synthase-like dioxygenase
VTSAPVLSSDALSPAAVDAAFRTFGGFHVELGEGEIAWRETIAAAHEFFALPRSVKAELAIEGSAHFRGWSEMHNERDWREQLHLGRELPDAGASPAFLQLEGPNFWPAKPAWRRSIENYSAATSALGERILGSVAAAMGLPITPFAGVGRDGYLVMKLIGYHPQASSQAARPGVAPHVDFSWVTMTLQDSPGLEVRSTAGEWTLIEPRPGMIWVHAGELLQFATRGRYQAAPHRVINHSVARTRVSIPLFVNPPLRGDVPVLAKSKPPAVETLAVSEHVHRVLPLDAPAVSFHFGDAEWRRKGLGVWCAECAANAAGGRSM